MSEPLEHRVHIGPAGWAYPDWDGIFYPPRRPRGFDALRYVASYFTLVEINSTFYRVPAPHVVRRWAERVADRPDFTFTLKAHQSLTHHGPSPSAELAALHRAIDPLAGAARLGAVLLQFPWSFRFDEQSRAQLGTRVRELHPHPLAVEVRHGSWATPEASEFLASLGVTVCGIDQPLIGESIPPYHHRAGPAGAYFRLHGRNYRNWFAGDAGRDARYDYLYTPDELSPWAAVIRRAAAAAPAAYVVLNNHFRGQAAANAFEMAFALFGRRPVAPETLRRAIPRLVESTTARGEPGAEPTLFDV